MTDPVLFPIILACIGVTGLCLTVLLVLVLGQVRRHHRQHRERYLSRTLAINHLRLSDRYLQKNYRSIMNTIATMRQIQVGNSAIDGLILRLIRLGFGEKAGRHLFSVSRYRVREAATDLSLLPCKRSRAWLARAFRQRLDPVTKLHLAMALIRLGDQRSIRLVIASLHDLISANLQPEVGQVLA